MAIDFIVCVSNQNLCLSCTVLHYQDYSLRPHLKNTFIEPKIDRMNCFKQID